uniref:Deoxyribonuclease I n=1 Tax=Lates calcarifer TaxID=8187 RepID=A0A4W6DQY1_LATCA
AAGAFNIKSFGDKKASNTTLMNIIKSSLNSCYDALCVYFPRGSPFHPPFRYGHIVSEPLGRSSYKERYLFLYRENTVSVVKSYTYDDGCEPCGTDTFIREPFVNFALIPQHTSPSSAVKEVDALYDVVADVRNRWNTNDIVLLGDFNAGCNYVTGSEWQQIRLFTDKSFHWLIPNDADTTVSHTNCPYDRYKQTHTSTWMHTQTLTLNHISYSAFGMLFSLSFSGIGVSDHFPVEVKLIG